MSEIPGQMSFEDLNALVDYANDLLDSWVGVEFTEKEADEYYERLRAFEEDGTRYTLEGVAEEFGVDLEEDE